MTAVRSTALWPKLPTAWWILTAALGTGHTLPPDQTRRLPENWKRRLIVLGPGEAQRQLPRFLERAAALSPDPSRHAERGLAAASAKRDAGALDAATALLVVVQHGPPDERRAAEVSRLRGQIALDLQRGSEAAMYLLNAARALESRDIQLARQIHLEALGAAVWAEGLDANHDLVVEAARSALAAPSAPLPPRPMDLVLDALALRFVDGFTAAAPGLIRALDVLIKESLDREAGRWLWAAGNNLGGIIALELFDSEARYSLGIEQVEADARHRRSYPVTGRSSLPGAHQPTVRRAHRGGSRDRRELLDQRRDRQLPSRVHRTCARGVSWPRS